MNANGSGGVRNPGKKVLNGIPEFQREVTEFGKNMWTERKIPMGSWNPEGPESGCIGMGTNPRVVSGGYEIRIKTNMDSENGIRRVRNPGVFIWRRIHGRQQEGTESG